MATITPRRSLRIPHMHTPKMTDRKKGLFQGEAPPQPESLTKHRRLPVLDSESDSDDCDLGIISTIDSSSGEETDQNTPKTPERTLWHETRSQTKKLKETHYLKNFMKSPFTLKKYQTQYSCPESKCGSSSTPATPHLRNHPVTPSSTHSCTSIHTTSSTSSKARKSLASLIADTESCSSSLKDLNFDSDSATDSKENTPTKPLRRSSRKHKNSPKLHSFKGVLLEQKKNVSPIKYPVVCLTKMDFTNLISPTQMLKTPHNTTEAKDSPPKLSHNRRSILEIEESPESVCDSEKSHKRLHYDGMSDNGPNSKLPRLDPSVAPKARLSLFNSDKLKEILSAKSFYGKSNPDLNTSIATKLSNAIESTATHPRRSFGNSKRKRKPGQINMGVKHKIRKPKYNKPNISSVKVNTKIGDISSQTLNKSVTSQSSTNDVEFNSTELVTDKINPFVQEQQTIEALLSQWTEEEVPESELSFRKIEVPCFNESIIEETSTIFQPVTATPVESLPLPEDSDTVIVELGATNNGQGNPGQEEMVTQDIIMADSMTEKNSKTTEFLPVDGGYIVVEDNEIKEPEELTDLDAIERELKMLDEQILQMAQSNNINAEAVLASTEKDIPRVSPELISDEENNTLKTKPMKLFSIFNKPNPGVSTLSKGTDKSRRSILKSIKDQYVIDAGQKKFGVTQCNECGVIYQIGDPQDEHDHLVHHNATDVLKFNGWKEECVVHRTESGRVVRVRGGCGGWRRVAALLARLVHVQLGYEAALPNEQHHYTAYLYVEKKQIVGCLIVEPKVKAYKLIPGDPDCCSVEDYPVKCGVSRIWTHASHRRKRIASQLLDCARATFLHGDVVRLNEVAFSAPTAAGKAFAAKYTGTENFFVYVD
ncbi:N-acetyltransferase ESCO2 [Papilio xuthus]|uniref:N-acetyltransferase ESCO2 n=1 Tax=Papilio xuthus TaxID=66420 RepID=A0A194QBI9_PAPXU|nr:N-acetyltransferase ESCO2 [Papilio xuthus]